MKLAAREMGTIKALKESLKRGGGSNETWIKGIPADGIVIRFLTEPEQWFGYYEWFDKDNKQFIPMAEGEILPDGIKPSFRYLATALDIENDRVIPIKLPKTVANSLMLKYEKYGSLGDRSYELEKFGEGLDTTYDVSPQAPSPLAIEKYELLDLESILIAARAKALGESQAEEPFPATDLDDDDDVATPETDTEAEWKKYESGESQGEALDEDLSSAALFGMTIRELRLAALENDIDPRGKTRNQLIEELTDVLED